jgi:RNA polymerase sigma-70 factor (ECF subfamily)
MQAAQVRATAPDQDIVELLRGGGGSERAFALLLDRYESRIYRLCCALLRDRAQAEDAAQESLIRIWKALPSYDERASLSTWIYAITRNRCLTALERRRDLGSLTDRSVAEEAATVVAPASAPAPDSENLFTRLRALVDRLPERYRRTLILYYYEERSVSEVAEMLAMPEGTVKTALHRARAALADQLRRQGLDDPAAWLETHS